MPSINKSKAVTVFITVGLMLIATVAEAQTQGTNSAFGFSLSAGIADVLHISGNDEDNVNWEPGIIAGGGLFFERMFTESFGIHTGLRYSYIDCELHLGSNGSQKILVENHTMALPFYFLTSFGSKLRLDILYGLSYMHILRNTMSGMGSSTTGTRFLNYNQFGAGLMVRLAFAFDRFTYLYIAPHSQFYFSNLIDESNWRDHLYTYQLDLGMFFKTF